MCHTKKIGYLTAAVMCLNSWSAVARWFYERSAEWQPERGCQKNSREADTERKRDDPDKSGIARKNKLPSSSEGSGKIVQGEPLQTE